MNSLAKVEKIRKENTILIAIAYIPLVIIVTRIGMLLNIGYKIDLDILDITFKSLKYKPLALPKSVEDLKLTFFFSIGWGLFMMVHITNKDKYMNRKEYGTAEWGKQSIINKFKEKEEEQNIILSKEVRFSIDDKKTMRNNNILIVGGSGTGKTRFYVKPNIMQMHSSFVVTDPKGELLRDTGKMLKEEGYVIKVIDLYNMEKSNKYNPFHYIKDEKDILKVINNLITNTNSGQKSSDPFWEKAETALLQSLFAFMWNYMDEEDQNFSTVLRLIEKIESKESNENHISAMDMMMKYYHKVYPNNFAYRQWLIYKQASGKTAKSILISTAVRLSMFNIKSLSDLTNTDEMELEKIGSRKTAVFILVSDSDSTYNFLVSMLYQQMFEVLYYQADFIENGRLQYPVRCIIDEFANIGQIPEFEKRLSTMRSRGISASIIIQNISQLEGLYKDNYKTIIGNCDSFVYLGGIEKESHKYVSELLGKGTIDNKTRGKTKGKSGSTNENFQRMGRELLTPDEVGRMDNKNCIVIYRGLQPYFSEKYNIENHSNYDQLYEGDDGNRFNFSEYKLEIRKRQRAPKKIIDKFNLLEEKIEKMVIEDVMKNEEIEDIDNSVTEEIPFTVKEIDAEETSCEEVREVEEISFTEQKLFPEKPDEKELNNELEKALDLN